MAVDQFSQSHVSSVYSIFDTDQLSYLTDWYAITNDHWLWRPHKMNALCPNIHMSLMFLPVGQFAQSSISLVYSIMSSDQLPYWTDQCSAKFHGCRPIFPVESFEWLSVPQLSVSFNLRVHQPPLAYIFCSKRMSIFHRNFHLSASLHFCY